MNTQIWKLNSPYLWVSFCPSSLLSLGLHIWSNSPSGRFSWLLRHYCDCQSFLKLLSVLISIFFWTHVTRKLQAWVVPSKNSIHFFENMTRFSSRKGRRIFWSLHLYPLIWKLPRLQSRWKQFNFHEIGSRSRKLQAWFHQSTRQTKVLNLQWQTWIKNLLSSPWLKILDNHRFPKSSDNFEIFPISNSF